jgi:hypothetical protein
MLGCSRLVKVAELDCSSWVILPNLLQASMCCPGVLVSSGVLLLLLLYCCWNHWCWCCCYYHVVRKNSALRWDRRKAFGVLLFLRQSCKCAACHGVCWLCL